MVGVPTFFPWSFINSNAFQESESSRICFPIFQRIKRLINGGIITIQIIIVASQKEKMTVRCGFKRVSKSNKVGALYEKERKDTK
jgi:hypothetical protein